VRALLGRFRLVGLRWRLAGWVAVVILACIGIAFVAVYRGTGTELRHQIDRELSADAHELASTLSHVHATRPHQLSAVATGYVRDQPFSTSSTLLFVEVPGAATSTNRPELFNSPPPDEHETLEQQRSENELSERLLAAPAGYTTLHLADIGKLRVLKMRLPTRLPGGAATIGVGESLETVEQAQAGVARAFILGGIIALAVALLGSYLIGVRVSRPLRRMAAVAARVDAGDLHPRMHQEGPSGDEVKVLADSFDHMLDRLTEAFAGQRAFVADASHELRTPLTVIRGQLEVLAAQPNPPAEEVRRVERLVGAEIARIGRLVDDMLLLAKTEQGEFLRVAPIELPLFVEELWDGITLLAERHFELVALPSGTLRADPDRLAQALRNLIGNAIEHTAPGHGLVRLTVARFGRGLRFVVEDDGPGIPPEQRERVFHRFHRTDSARSRSAGGTGLGLAIVRAIADAHGGSVRAEASQEGGARMVLELPGFVPGARGRESERAAGPLALDERLTAR